MAFINAVADVARALDHHPDLTNVFDRVTLAVTTHDAGGLTSLDVEFARRVNALPTA
jgi:4a-hydroxytetrahydrobiopterin dehydratase